MKEQEFNLQWESIGISNDFVFCKVMQDKALLTELIHLILPELEFTDLLIIAQKTESDGADTHSVRFDIFVKDKTGRVIEIEMQVLNTGNLPLRIRFYGSMLDMQMLNPGESYGKLKERYIILICPFDPFGEGRHYYSFTSRCDQNHELVMGDKTMNIVLNAVGTMDDVNGRLAAFLDYVAGKPSEDEYVQKLDAAVKLARSNKEWRKEYMTLRMRDLENQEIGEERGRKEIIANMLRKGKSPEEVADLCDVSIDLVREVEESMLVSQ